MEKRKSLRSSRSRWVAASFAGTAAAGITLLIAACGTAEFKGTTPSSRGPSVTHSQFQREINLVKRYIQKGRHGRKYHRSMKPRYITVHSTQNYSGDAWDHARALENGKLRAYKRRGGNRIGYLTWHFTVQEDVAIQHLPTNEQGEHADFDGPGNNYSIGIEMCEHHGNSRTQTTDRTAKLCASLMHQYNIPLKNVVPHYHWPRKGQSPEHKNCPHFLLDNGKPGRKWKGFLAQVNSHYKRIQ
ncbi:MAG: N-acetylmuramoyl-L-alanine amidase [Verrucomicrobiota bacterium]